MAQILITNIKGLVQVRQNHISRVEGAEMGELPVIEDAYLIITNGLISEFGTMSSLSKKDADEVIDASDRFVLPAFVDSHTHLVFAASREEEFVYKIKGMSYEEIAKRGGGILNSAKKLQAASEDELFEKTMHRAQEIMNTGTGAVEIKSGYGLTLKDELKMLRVAKKIGEATPLTVKTTLLGAHAVPKDISKDDYLKLVIEEMIPAAADENLADYVDAFCEKNFFTPEETEAVMEAGKKYGMTPKIHANQLSINGGVQVGVKTNAISVDHLENIGEEEINALKGVKTIGTLLPGAAFYLGTSFPPARKMIEAGLGVALATDFNPGSSPCGSMPFMLSLACIKMKMLPEEAINAATINGAYAMELKDHGQITKGFAGSVIITKKIPSLAYIPYAFSSDQIDEVIIKGERVSKV
ncbi:MAG: imidazolonepropionase [Candidatus Cyclobacteriaceae bacterium M2_1C_046]